jgi:LysM repeat protein
MASVKIQVRDVTNSFSNMATTYSVQAGDTLSAIAKRHGVPLSSVTGYKSGNPNLITPGEVLTITPLAPVANQSTQAGPRMAPTPVIPAPANVAPAAQTPQPVQSPVQQPQTQPQPVQSPTAPTQETPDITRAAESIANIESGGNYQAVGPETGKGKAYGKYQVMDFNIPSWTREALGQQLTPEQFLASPEAQETVFNFKFQQFADQYGGYNNAAKVWFGGPGGLTNPGAQDILGTTTQKYSDRFSSTFGKEQPQQFNAVSTPTDTFDQKPQQFNAVSTPVDTFDQKPQESYQDTYNRNLGQSLEQYGLTPDKLASGFQTNPTNTLSSLVEQVTTSLGLPDVRSNIEKITTDIESISNERDKEIETIQDNPWKSAGSKSELIARITDKYEKRINNRVNKLTLLQNTYDDARQEAQFAVSTALNLYDKQRTFDQNRMNEALDRAEKRTEAERKLGVVNYSIQDVGGRTVRFGFDQGGSIVSQRDLGASSSEQITPGDYSSKQLTYISKLRENIADNDVYKKTVNMRTYANSVEAALSQAHGPGDIAAINQFQKVIDEGAVTRDQDVKLIQGAQSLVNQFKGQIARLEGGDQLLPEQRDQIRSTVNALYEAQIKAIEKDPYIMGAKHELKLNKIKEEDTVLGQLKNFAVTSSQPTATQSNDESVFDEVVGKKSSGGYLQNLWSAIIGG